MILTMKIQLIDSYLLYLETRFSKTLKDKLTELLGSLFIINHFVIDQS